MNKPSLKNNGFAHLGVVLVIAVVIIIGGIGGYLYHKDHKSKPVATSNNTSGSTGTSQQTNSSTSTGNSSVATPTNPYTGWKTYSDSHVSFMYPSGWQVGVGADQSAAIDDTATSPSFTSNAMTTANNPGAPITFFLQLSTDSSTVDCSSNPCTVAAVVPINNSQLPNTALAVVDQTSGNGTKYSQYVVVSNSTKVGDTVVKAVKDGSSGIYIFGQPYYTPKTSELTTAARVTNPAALQADSHFKDLLNIIDSIKFK